MGASIEKVVSGGFCIGCGVCRGAAAEIRMEWNEYGEIVADLSAAQPAARERAGLVCPFGEASAVETSLAREVFQGASHDELVGSYVSLLAGYAVEERAAGSSGGIVTWLLKELLRSGAVDAVVHVHPGEQPGPLFSFKVVRSAEEVALGATSFYHPVSYGDVLQYIRENPGRYAVTGVPCFQKGLRLLKRTDAVYGERIRYQIGLVCGQMKSRQYVDYLLRVGGAEGEARKVCFRKKVEGARADDYAFEAEVRGENGESRTVTLRNRAIGANWGMGLFKPKACDYCDDVYAELADVAVMDGWLPQYVSDGRGTSLVVVRSGGLLEVIKAGMERGELELEESTLADIVKSQLGAVLHRRRGVAFRLALGAGRWRPPKRMKAALDPDWLYSLLLLARVWLRRASRAAMRAQRRRGRGLGLYKLLTAIPLKAYQAVAAVRRDYPSLSKKVGVESNYPTARRR